MSSDGIIDLYERHARAYDRVRAHVADDPDCGGRTVWLATFDGGTAGRSEAHGAGGGFTTT